MTCFKHNYQAKLICFDSNTNNNNYLGQIIWERLSYYDNETVVVGMTFHRNSVPTLTVWKVVQFKIIINLINKNCKTNLQLENLFN